MAFEALVKSVLRQTSSENRLARAAIVEGVQKLLPAHDYEEIRPYVDSALDRLARKTVKHWIKEDQFCLAHEEVLRLREYLADQANKETALLAEIQDACNDA